MPGYAELGGEDVSYHAFLVYDVRYPTWEESEGVGHPVELPHLAPLVAEQDEGQAVLLDKPLMRLYVIRAYTISPRLLASGLLIAVPEVTGFLGATRGVVLWVEEEDYGLLPAQEVPKADLFSRLGEQREVWTVSPTPTLPLVRRKPIDSSPKIADLLLTDSASRLYRPANQAGVDTSARLSLPAPIPDLGRVLVRKDKVSLPTG